jgi:hypothetical protein
MTEFWDKPAEKSGKVLAAFLEGLPLGAPTLTPPVQVVSVTNFANDFAWVY